MIWMAWRQHRGELIIAACVLALIVGFLLVEGVQMHDAYQQLGVANCLTDSPTVNTQNCANIIEGFDTNYGWLDGAILWLNLVPALLAILVGAPLVAREVENGTHRLVWTQSVTRSRWIATQLALMLGTGLVAAIILTVTLTWFRQPFDALQGRFISGGFDFEGIVLLAYMLFALALGIAAGVLLRRTILAMVVTLAAFLAVRLPIEFWLRPRYMTPLTTTRDLLSTAPSSFGRGDWIISEGWVDAQGHSISDYQAFSTCAPQNVASKVQFFQCMHAHGWLDNIVYQPADRFWPFQGIESAILVALAVALIVFAIYWVRQRVS